MPRARNIKPSLFKNELLGVADPVLTIVFTSLWCLADRRGRLEDRPLRIKAETFPYREISPETFNGYLTELARLGFIRRFTVDDKAVIQVVNFDKHQSPHHTEKESELPCEPDKHGLTVKEPLSNGGSPVQERSDSLIPDLLIPDRGVGSEEPKTRKKPNLVSNDNEWLESLKKEKIYDHIDLDAEARKAERWLIDNAPTRQFTKRYFTGWINRIQRPLNITSKPTIPDEEAKARADFLASMEMNSAR